MCNVGARDPESIGILDIGARMDHFLNSYENRRGASVESRLRAANHSERILQAGRRRAAASQPGRKRAWRRTEKPWRGSSRTAQGSLRLGEYLSVKGRQKKKKKKLCQQRQKKEPMCLKRGWSSFVRRSRERGKGGATP